MPDDAFQAGYQSGRRRGIWITLVVLIVAAAIASFFVGCLSRPESPLPPDIAAPVETGVTTPAPVPSIE